MNQRILDPIVQQYILQHTNDDSSKIALGKSPFDGIDAAELAGQIAARKKSFTKLPEWASQTSIYYPSLLSIEQTSSSITAAYKSTLASGRSLIDLTAGFGVDSYFFSKTLDEVTSCEIDSKLSAITAHNAAVLGAKNIKFYAGDGLDYLKTIDEKVDNIYLDPVRRKSSSKVFMLKDCTPDVPSHLDLLLKKSSNIIVKTAPLLDIAAGLQELRLVKHIHIVSVKNECKEILWQLGENEGKAINITCVALNKTTKTITFDINRLQTATSAAESLEYNYLYEPDVALMKSGAFNFIASFYGLTKIDVNSHLYLSNQVNADFIGRIFEIQEIIPAKDLKKAKNLKGNVIVRNYPETAQHLQKKFKISSDEENFYIFTQHKRNNVVIAAKIIQRY